MSSLLDAIQKAAELRVLLQEEMLETYKKYGRGSVEDSEAGNHWRRALDLEVDLNAKYKKLGGTP
jgi:hypothetical protein